MYSTYDMPFFFPSFPDHSNRAMSSCVHIRSVALRVGNVSSNTSIYHIRSAVFTCPQWLACCATNRKVAGSIPASVSGFFIDIKSFSSIYGSGVDSASNRNEYQEHFLGVKAAGA